MKKLYFSHGKMVNRNGQEYKVVKVKEASIQDLDYYFDDNEHIVIELEKFKKIKSIKKHNHFITPFSDRVASKNPGSLNTVIKEHLDKYGNELTTMKYIRPYILTGSDVIYISDISEKSIEKENSIYKILQLDDVIEVKVR